MLLVFGLCFGSVQAPLGRLGPAQSQRGHQEGLEGQTVHRHQGVQDLGIHQSRAYVSECALTLPPVSHTTLRFFL